MHLHTNSAHSTLASPIHDDVIRSVSAQTAFCTRHNIQLHKEEDFNIFNMSGKEDPGAGGEKHKGV